MLQKGQKTIYVYEDFTSEKAQLIGELYVNASRGSETFSFEYNRVWLNNCGDSISIDPQLPLYAGRHYPSGKELFGCFEDASPDRWGRELMKRRERIQADQEGRRPEKLLSSDYLLGVYDESRMGGLRFKLDPSGPFLSSDAQTATAPWTSLRTLEEASRNFERDENTLSKKWLESLIRSGSSLGGARPKATVVDPEGQLWIAKFPSKHDENDAGAWEKTVHDLARMCGLNVPESKLEKFSKTGSTFLVKRFDREGEKRLHFASAMTLLDKSDGADASDGTGYLELASFIKASGARPKEDLIELWKRIVFNMAVTNTDDHLRNHAFMFSRQGWILSPLYDVNPVPYGNELALNVDENDNRISIPLVCSTARHYGICAHDAKNMANDILFTIKENWMRVAESYGLSHTQIENMKPAFQLCEVRPENLQV